MSDPTYYSGNEAKSQGIRREERMPIRPEPAILVDKHHSQNDEDQGLRNRTAGKYNTGNSIRN